MEGDLSWERVSYDSRIDQLAGDIGLFVDTVLQTIDIDSAKSHPAKWEKVCEYFAGCIRAARAQGITSQGGVAQIVRHLNARFPYQGHGSDEGFFEFMDWLSKPDSFAPSALRAKLRKMSP